MRRYRRLMRRRRRSGRRRWRSARSYRRGVFGDIGDCGVGMTPQMCNRVTNHADMTTFSKPALVGDFMTTTSLQSLLEFFFQEQSYWIVKL